MTSEIKYRVRDKHTTAAPGKVWGSDLTEAQAHKLKESVVGGRKSTTARVEPMSVAMPVGGLPAPKPIMDKQIVEARAKATAAAQGAAQAAQARSDAMLAAKKAAEQIAAMVPPDFDTSEIDDLVGTAEGVEEGEAIDIDGLETGEIPGDTTE